jgi:hypothetical protein
MAPKIRAGLAMLLCAAGLATASCSSSPSASNEMAGALTVAAPFIETLSKSVPGLSEAQAILGAGSLLGLAKTEMPAESFSQVSKAVPGTDALIAEAVKQGAPAAPTSLAQVGSFLNSKGISATQVNQLAAAIGQTVKSSVPETVAGAFTTAME